MVLSNNDSSSLVANRTKINLLSRKDWDRWLSIIQVKAEADDVWDIINPSLTYDIH